MILGFEHLHLQVSMPLVEQERAMTMMREPVPGLLLETDGGWFLVDSGFNTPLVRDPWLHRRFFPSPDYQPELVGPDDGDPLVAAFELAGVDPADVVGVIISHLHVDHAGGLRHFAGQCPVYLQRAELEISEADPKRSELTGALFRIDWDDPNIDWRLLDGDAVLAPGIEVVLTAGHTAGHQSVAVTLDASVRDQHDSNGYVFACDAADLQENLDREQPVSAQFGLPHEITREGIKRLKAIGAERGLRVLPGHDPVVWPAFAAEMGVKVFE